MDAQDCANVILCQKKVDGPGATHCLTCRLFQLPDVQIVDNKNEEPCAVCFETNTEPRIMFPTQCGHSFCASCVRNIVFFSPPGDSNVMASPIPFGCPPCPNAECDGPRGCTCEEWLRAVERWETQRPADFYMWLVHNAVTNMNTHANERSCRGSRKCPMCRSKLPALDDARLERLQLAAVLRPNPTSIYVP